MDMRIEALRDWGCDIDGAMERMLDDEQFYLECLREIPGDPNFASLTKALSEGNAKDAFNSSHTLKGVLINLGLTPMYDKTVEIVEPLRAGRIKEVMRKNAELERMRQKLANILSAE